MRSKIGTKSRLAAHMAALLLLVAAIIHMPNAHPEGVPKRRRPTVERMSEPVGPVIPPVPPALPAAEPVLPVDEGEPLDAPKNAPPGETIATAGQAFAPPVVGPSETVDTQGTFTRSGEPLRPPSVEDDTRDADAAVGDTADADAAALLDAIVEDAEEVVVDAAGETGGEEPETPSREDEDNGAPAQDDAFPEAQEGPAILPQPDESGAIVIAPLERGEWPVDAEPLPNASLEVFGNNVYWLGPDHDLEVDLATIPELGGLVVLASLEGYKVHGFEHVKTEIIPADLADLDGDAAERFLHLTADPQRPVVVAARPGARGAAFFKGAYILANRTLSVEEMLREVEPELDEAGSARDDIIHRLMRLRD